MRRAIPLILFALVLACESSDVGFVEPVNTPEEEPPPPAPKDSIGPYLEITNPPVTEPNAAVGGAGLPFRWRTIPGVDDPDQVRWVLLDVPDVHGSSFDAAFDYIRQTPDAPEWSEWTDYDPEMDQGTAWFALPDQGPYLFVVQGRVVGGSINQDFDLRRNARRVLSVTHFNLVATLTSEFMDPFPSASMRTPPIILNLPVGTPVKFCWTGHEHNDFFDFMWFRYAWDILDIRNESEWDVWYTQFDGSETCSATRTFQEVSTHSFLLDVMGPSGYVVRFTVTINFVSGDALRSFNPTLDRGEGSCEKP